ncbi:MAG TPA: class II aldolase/adducin family protein [Candidatus Pullichristensenella excrementigallinarum]|uniref:Class II aldolase/adducin family protein n=1 Tax=Candidatus Pullichristensenella excrementigallinarum TaxID=2840907 RepID=A0A9D1IF96_9FIRM|nr:class II aldolase/adducin family protein [Candidatus Pullichristensenella excrementigallinarum]
MYLSDKEAKLLLIDIGKKMSAGGYVTANDGNMTMRVGEDEVWATPTGVNKGDLTEDKLIRIRISDGAVLEGTWKPTSEIRMHLNVYRTDNEVVSTAHAHPTYLCALACAGIELDMPTTPAACAISGRVPVAPFAAAGTQALADSVVPFVKDYHLVNLGNHGPLSWGKKPEEAWFRLEDAEAAARLAIMLLQIGRLRPLNKAQLAQLFEFHKVPMTEAGTVKIVESNANQEPAIPFSELYKELFK